MSNQFKIIIVTTVSCVLLLIAGVALLGGTEQTPINRSDLVSTEANSTGNANTEVYLVEFSDFECPACGMFEPVVREIIAKNSDKMQISYRHFPLSQHKQALYAAYASEAALKQGKFWEMHDYLFDNQAKLSPDFIDEGAKQLGLNMEQYKKDVASDEVKAKVAADQAAGTKFGVNSTPSFFLNGKKLYLRTTEDLLTAVNKALYETK